jgi:hypothetical protein
MSTAPQLKLQSPPISGIQRFPRGSSIKCRCTNFFLCNHQSHILSLLSITDRLSIGDTRQCIPDRYSWVYFFHSTTFRIGALASCRDEGSSLPPLYSTYHQHVDLKELNISFFPCLGSIRRAITLRVLAAPLRRSAESTGKLGRVYVKYYAV